jgi:hypothetical protein
LQFFFFFFFLEKFVLAFLDFKTMGKMETGRARLYLEGLYFFLALADGCALVVEGENFGRMDDED